MKRRTVLAVCGAALVAGLACADVSSVNAAGYVMREVLPGGGATLIGVPFYSFSGAESTTLVDLLGTNQLRAAATYDQADRVLLWNRGSLSYNYFAIKSTDGQWHSAQNATAWFTGPATNPVVAPGDGLWVLAPEATAQTNRFALMGEVVGAEEMVLEIGEGLNLICNPFTCDLDLNESDLANDGALAATTYDKADRIHVWNKETKAYKQYALKQSDMKWHYANNAAEWFTGPAVTNPIQVGEGFWYIRATNAPLYWSETNKYLGNLRN